MECPRCGYALSAFDRDCPRCAHLGKPISPPPPLPPPPPPTASSLDPALAIRCYRCGIRFNRSLWQWSSRCPSCRALRWASVESITVVNFAYWGALALLLAVAGGLGLFLALAGLYFINRAVFSLFGTARLYRP